MGIMQQYDNLWQMAINIQSEDDDTFNFNKLRLNRQYVIQIDNYLKTIFQQCSNENLYDLHLNLTELCSDYKINSKHTKVLYLAQLFQTWLFGALKHAAKINRVHLYDFCQYSCLCCFNELHIQRAFDLSTRYHLNLFYIFIKIYKFSDYAYLIQNMAIERYQQFTYSDQAVLLGELHLQNFIDIRQVFYF